MANRERTRAVLFGDIVEASINWVLSTNGAFSDHQLGQAVGLQFNREQLEATVAMLIEYGLIKPYGGRHGMYIKSDDSAPIMDWQNAQVDDYPLYLPMWLSKRVVISPGNLIVVAGEKNSGKTAFALRVAFENLAVNGGAHNEIFHFDYESHPAELKTRLMSIAPRFDAWSGFTPMKRLHDFHSVIRPNGLNIIDYLKIGGTRAQFTEAGALFEQIHEALRDGVCIVMVQKKKGEEFARGGELTTEEARLGLSLYSDGPTKWARITKCKFPREYPNPEGMELDYELDHTAEFTPVTEWRYVTSKERKKVNEEYLFQVKRQVLIDKNRDRGFLV